MTKYLALIAAALVMGACSQDDALQTTVNDNNELKAMTITATLPESGMATRAAGGTDATVARCFVQVLDSEGEALGDEFSLVKEMSGNATSGFTTTVYLNADDTYTFLFWADSDNGSAPDDLKNVSYSNGEVIAWAGKMADTWSADGISCTLSHVVARITVHSSTAVELSEENYLTCLVPTVYTAYNVLEGAVSGNPTSGGYTYTDGTSSCSANGDLCHFYVLVGDNEGNQTLTLQYNGVLGNPAVTVQNVPLKANCHTTLSGDVYNLGMTSGTIKTTISTDWGETGDEDF